MRPGFLDGDHKQNQPCKNGSRSRKNQDARGGGDEQNSGSGDEHATETREDDCEDDETSQREKDGEDRGGFQSTSSPPESERAMPSLFAEDGSGFFSGEVTRPIPFHTPQSADRNPARHCHALTTTTRANPSRPPPPHTQYENPRMLSPG